MKNIIVILVAVCALWQFSQLFDSVSLGPGVQVADEPQQVNGTYHISHHIKGYNIKGLAQFDITAKVLAKENYHFGREANISPTDLALGWGNMSDERILANIEISQSNRFYRWRVERLPIPRNEIETHSANMHLIPSNDLVKHGINSVKQGEIIQMSGKLVEVTSATDSWRWRSSLTRNDTGNGACELMLVENFQVLSL